MLVKCVTLWVEDASLFWYIGYCIDIFGSDSKILYKIEHLHRSDPDRISNLKWKYPTTDDARDVECEQILQSEVNGEWNFSMRNRVFALKNHADIGAVFAKAINIE